MDKPMEVDLEIYLGTQKNKGLNIEPAEVYLNEIIASTSLPQLE